MITEKEFDESLQYYLNKGDKIEDMRDDIRLRPLAKKLGYTPQYGGNFGDSLSFVKGKKVIWYCIRFSKNNAIMWACANVIDGSYKKHRYYKGLEEALTKEK